MTDWREIEEFPNYLVNEEGEVANATGKVLKPMMNQQGLPFVILSEGASPHSRSVARLVAKAFVEPHANPKFKTVIQLNGDREDCRARNLMWRPRWFAIRYHQQFTSMELIKHSLDEPILDITHNVVYDSSAQIVLEHGVLNQDVRFCLVSGDTIFPTNIQVERA